MLMCIFLTIGQPIRLHARSSFRQSADHIEWSRRSKCGIGHHPIVQSRRVSTLTNRSGGVPFSLFDNLSRSHIHRILPASFAFIISSTKGFAYTAVNRQVHDLVTKVDSNSEPCLCHAPKCCPHPLKSEGGGSSSSESQFVETPVACILPLRVLTTSLRVSSIIESTLSVCSVVSLWPRTSSTAVSQSAPSAHA